MTKAKMVSELAEKNGLTKAQAERAARDGRNPQTGETIHIAARKAVAFKAGKALKDVVNK